MATRGSQLLSCIKSSCEPDAGQLVMLLGVYLLCSPPLNGLFGKCDKDCARPLLPLSLFSHSVASDSLRPHRLQHTRLPCPSLTPGACSNSCPLSWWCHLTISSSVTLFSSCSQSFPASGIFSKELGFLWGNIKRQLNPNHDAVKSHMTARAASTPDFSASGSRSKLLLTSRGVVPHRTLPDGQCRYPYPECNALMLSVLGKILRTCIPLLRGCIFTIDNKEIHIRYRQQGDTYSL